METIRNRLASDHHFYKEGQVTRPKTIDPANVPIEILSSDEDDIQEIKSKNAAKGPEFPMPHPFIHGAGDSKSFSLPKINSSSQQQALRPIQPPFPMPVARPAMPPSSSKEDDRPTETFNIPVGSAYDPAENQIYHGDANVHLRELLESSIGTGAAELEDVDMSEAIVEGFKPGVKLLPHQVQGRTWMKERETGKKVGGILADMGLGKTIQTITRIIDGKPSKSDLKDEKSGQTGVTLVVAPVGLIKQWAKEIETMCERHINVVEHHGSSRTDDPKKLAKADIVITSYNVLASEHGVHTTSASNHSTSKKKKNDSSNSEEDEDSNSDSDDAFSKKMGKALLKKAPKAKTAKKGKKTQAALFGLIWWRVVLDEAQNIKNRNTKAAKACYDLEAKYRWVLTGTPIQNNVEELYSLFRFLGIKPLNDWDNFKTHIAAPVKQGRSTKAMKRLHVVLSAIMLRRTKTQTIGGKPLLSLPGRTVQVIECEFDDDERAFYKALEERTSVTINKFVRRGEVMKNYTSMLLLLLRLRQACDHPSLISKDFTKDQEAIDMRPATTKEDGEGSDDGADELAAMMGKISVTPKCDICQAELEPDSRSKVCEECEIQVALKARRKSLPASSSSNLPPSSAKIRKMLELLDEIKSRSDTVTDEDGNELKKKRREKTIIFSQFTSMLDLMEPFLQEEGIDYVRYDGSMNPKKRQEALEYIQDSKRTRVILISFKAGGTGLNLTMCNNVILMDLWWNPALEDQAFDRAHRLGQTRDVNIYKLTVPETVEGRILGLQDRKRVLAAAALSGGKLANNKLGLDDLMALFRNDGGRDDDDD